MILELLRKEISKGKETRYRIAKKTGVSEAQLHLLVHGGSLKAETVDVLLKHFGYEIRKKVRRK